VHICIQVKHTGFCNTFRFYFPSILDSHKYPLELTCLCAQKQTLAVIMSCHVKFEVFMAVKLWIVVFWVVMLCRLVGDTSKTEVIHSSRTAPESIHSVTTRSFHITLHNSLLV
jgi:hypothetical protein